MFIPEILGIEGTNEAYTSSNFYDLLQGCGGTWLVDQHYYYIAHDLQRYQVN